jgi:hypothetical protein
MYAKTDIGQDNRVSMAVIGYGAITAMITLLIVAGLIVAHAKLFPHYEAGSDEISVPSNLT